MRTVVFPAVARTVKTNPALLHVASTASSVLRQLAIKPYTPAKRTREFSLLRRLPSLHAVRNQIYCEKGAGSQPTIVIAGFVPDATEVIEFQRSTFKRFGSIYYVNYARNGFNGQLFHAQLADLISDLNAKGERPVLFGISFGAGLITEFLRLQKNEGTVQIRGVVMASPVLCADDLVRGEGNRQKGTRMLESCIRRILAAGAEGSASVSSQIERARRCFQALFENGAENRSLSGRHLSIRRKIMNVIEQTPANGGYERLLALRDFVFPTQDSLFAGPVLTLLAEAEDHLLVPTSPTLATLRDSRAMLRLFPRGVCKKITSFNADDPVSHASLIFHHEEYNLQISSWYSKQAAPTMFAVI